MCGFLDFSCNLKIVLWTDKKTNLLAWLEVTIHSLFKIKIRLEDTVEWLLLGLSAAIPELT